VASYYIAFCDIYSFIKKHIFLILFLTLGVTFFTRNNFKEVWDIRPEVRGQPKMQKLDNAAVISFKRNGYAYEASPLYSYELNALVVSKRNYKVYTIERFQKTFPCDLCMIWGSNVEGAIYRNKTINFSQDGRWCFVRWSGEVKFNWDDFSNSHLLVTDPAIERKINSLVIGDQVKIEGRLVNVRAALIGAGGSFDSLNYTWNSGVGKSGLGAGACKVIYVEKLDILKKANVLSYFLFRLSLCGLIVLMGWRTLRFFGVIKE